MTQGVGNCVKLVIIYLSTGCMTIFARRTLEGKRTSIDYVDTESQNITDPPHWIVQRFYSRPLIFLTSFLLIGSLLLHGQPWKHIRSTLLFDVVTTILSVLFNKALREKKQDCGVVGLGTNPLGNLNYNPGTDPYYISNLESPLDDFIENALEGVQITNIVHIVLESMRADSYPFKEESELMTYIKKNFEFRTNAKPATISNVSPFIASLAEHTISWETVWSTIPFTHKAMLGRISDFVIF